MKQMSRADAVRRVTVLAWECTCQRCGHQWRTLDEAAPARCAKCKDPRWTQPKVYGGGRKRIPALPDDGAFGGPEVVRESAEERVERCRVGRTWYYRFLEFTVADGKRVGGRFAEPASGRLVKVPHDGQTMTELFREAVRLDALQREGPRVTWSDRSEHAAEAR
jgi:hypothetical protein